MYRVVLHIVLKCYSTIEEIHLSDPSGGEKGVSEVLLNELASLKVENKALRARCKSTEDLQQTKGSVSSVNDEPIVLVSDEENNLSWRRHSLRALGGLSLAWAREGIWRCIVQWEAGVWCDQRLKEVEERHQDMCAVQEALPSLPKVP